jgi:hypothetical protein
VGASGRRYTFGENGPETVVPGMGGAAGGIVMNFNIDGDVSEKTAQAIKDHVDASFSKLGDRLTAGRRR